MVSYGSVSPTGIFTPGATPGVAPPAPPNQGFAPNPQGALNPDYNPQAAPGTAGSLAPPPASTPPVEPTVMSSSNVDQTNTDNQKKIQGYPPSGQIVAGDGFVRNSDQSFAEAPSDAIGAIGENGQQTWSSGGLSYALGPSGGKVSSDPNVQSIYDQFTSLKAQMDATGAANIANIQATFKSLIDAQAKTNAGEQAGTYSLLARGGSLQTESSGGIIQSQISDGLSKIADLNTKEQSAVIAAQSAMQNGDMQMLDKQLSIAQQSRTEQQAAAQKLSDSIISAKQKVMDQQQAASKDKAVQAVLESGITDPGQVLKTLQSQGYSTISAQDITSTIANLNPDAKEVHSTLVSAAQNGAPQSVLAAIGSAKTLGDALAAAGRYVTDPTSLAGQFQAAVAAGYKGTPGDWVAAQKYKEAYAAASAAEKAKAQFVGTSANQQKLEQEGRAVILKEVSNRSGGLGLQDAKVNQAIHLKALFDQYKTTRVVQNTAPNTGVPLRGTHTETVYNIPSSQYTELAMGLASLISPSNTVAEATINKITQATARGDINAAITYATGSPQPGSTQAVFQNLKDSVDRQGTIAEQERQTYIDNLANLLPTDLSADRRAALLSGSGLNSYTNPTPAQMTPAQIDADAFSKIQTWSADPKNAALLTELSTTFPNLSNVELAQKLKLIP